MTVVLLFAVVVLSEATSGVDNFRVDLQHSSAGIDGAGVNDGAVAGDVENEVGNARTRLNGSRCKVRGSGARSRQVRRRRSSFGCR